MTSNGTKVVNLEQGKPIPFFSSRDWIAFLITAVIALVVYLWTVAPTVSLEDSGEMAVAADYLGVPHPPGYPLWTFLAWLFTEIFSFVSFRGQPNPAWAVGAMSGFFGALTAGLVAMMVSRVASRCMTPSWDCSTSDPTGTDNRSPLPMIAGIASGLCLTFAPVPWSQAVIVEIYTMNAFMVILQLLVACMWAERQTNKLLFMMTLLFGVSLTHYFFASAVNLAIPAVAIFLKNKKLFWDCVAAGLALLAFWIFFGKAFGEAATAIHRSADDTFRWMTGNTDWLNPEMLEKMGPKCGYILSGMIWMIAPIVVSLILRYGWPDAFDKNVERIIKIATWCICLGAAYYLFTKSYRTGSMLHALALKKKEQAFASGMMFLAIPFVFWAIQSKVFPAAKKNYMLLIIPFSILCCFLLAGQHFIQAFAFAKPFGPGSIPYAEFGIMARSKHIVVATLAAMLAAGIWIFRGKVFPEWRRILIMLLIVGGAWWLIHLYLPLASDQNPPMNWGYPRTWAGFKHAVFRGQYQKIIPSNPGTAMGFRQNLHYFQLLFRQFTVPIALLGLFPLTCWTLKLGNQKLRGGMLCFLLAIIATPIYVGTKAYEHFAIASVSDTVNALNAVFVGFIGILAVFGLIALTLGWLFKWILSHPLGKAQGITVIAAAVLTMGLMVLVVLLSSDTIRECFTPRIIRPTAFSTAYWAEAKIQIAMIMRTVAALALAFLLFCYSIILTKKYLDWLLRLKLETRHCYYMLIAIIPVMAGFILLISKGNLYFDLERSFEAMREPFTKKHLLGEMLTNSDSTRHFQVGAIPCNGLAAAILIYIFSALLVTVRQWAITDSEVSQPQITSQWNISEPFRHWFLITLGAFFGWGLLFACFANIKMNIQDIFIQRVKFLASYAIYALWIGFGLLVLWEKIVQGLFSRSRKTVASVAVLMMLLLPIVPLLNCKYNRKLIHEVGGPEQTGHDFGWQFGNYQLRGGDAIIEELEPDEEPPPNPEYPLGMGQDAVFYGGTDPGRFVPTYMIFSALVRPDVFLITQNALADNTYMSVMRDLYGDKIWIPSVKDSHKAFEIFVNKVQAGEIPNQGNLQIGGGRVQVHGVRDVMIINGILAKMIFDANIEQHPFYVEESYVIDWMYPYLIPHGLIMQINHETMPKLTGEMITNDIEFWDWYVQRLTSREDFRRDVAARKSFSKLRSALAGLYFFRLTRGHNPDPTHAERAYRDAMLFYPLSPEANFRLADLYMKSGRTDRAKRIMQVLHELDPGSDKPLGFLLQIERSQEAMDRKKELEQLLATKNGKLEHAFELADIYGRANMQAGFDGLMNQILAQTNIPPNIYATVSGISMKYGRLEHAENALQLFLARVPADPGAWLTLGAVRTALKHNAQAVSALEKAVQISGDPMLEQIMKDARFKPLYNDTRFKALFQNRAAQTRKPALPIRR